MELFKGKNLVEFAERFKSDESCIEYLAHIKWKDGFKCVKCGHMRSQTRINHSRTCNKCSHTESATANTLFHKVKFGVKKAFFICFEMVTTTKNFSARYVAKRYGITEKTARLFMHKIREAMKSSGNYPMDGNVYVGEFVIGGKEEGKVGRNYSSRKKNVLCAVQLTDEGKVRQMCSMRIENYSLKELKKFFVQHISEQATVTTNCWKGYLPLMKEYNITQIESDGGLSFKTLHTMIHQVKSWIRTTYSCVSEYNINRYLDEFCFRINHSQMKENIFNNLIERMVESDKLYQKELICS